MKLVREYEGANLLIRKKKKFPQNSKNNYISNNLCTASIKLYFSTYSCQFRPILFIFESFPLCNFLLEFAYGDKAAGNIDIQILINV